MAQVVLEAGGGRVALQEGQQRGGKTLVCHQTQSRGSSSPALEPRLVTRFLDVM